MDDKTLYEASTDVLYEWEQFNACVDMLRTFKPQEQRTGQEHVLFNALLTSAVIYSRNLIQFLYGSKQKSDDIIAEDYCRNWASLQPPKTALLEDAATRTNKLAAHLTYSRRKINRYWEWTAIRNDLELVWNYWKQCTPPHLLKIKR